MSKSKEYIKRQQAEYHRSHKKRISHLHELRRLKNPNLFVERTKRWRHDNREGFNSWARKNYKKNKTKLSLYRRRYYERHCERIKARSRIYHHDRYKRLKIELFQAYGERCLCCGETRKEFLTLDHVNGNGGAERRRIGGGGVTMYAYLKRRGWPKKNYRILCMNCNFALGHSGYCPHKKEAKT